MVDPAGAPVVDPARAPSLVYPLDGAVMPDNVFPPDVQWENGAPGDVIRITLEKPSSTIRGYLTMGSLADAHWQVDETAWRRLTRSDPEAPATVEITRYEAATGALIADRNYQALDQMVAKGLRAQLQTGNLLSNGNFESGSTTPTNSGSGVSTFSSISSARSTRLSTRSWSSASRIWKPCASPASCQCRRSQRCAMPWKVPIHSAAPGTPSSDSMRARISPAALLVNVTARMLCGEAFSACTHHTTRWVSTRVLPLPAPASTSKGPSQYSTAAFCGGFIADMRRRV